MATIPYPGYVPRSAARLWDTSRDYTSWDRAEANWINLGASLGWNNLNLLDTNESEFLLGWAPIARQILQARQ